MEELFKQMMDKDKARQGQKENKNSLSAIDKYGLMAPKGKEDDELDPNDPLVKMLDMMLQQDEKAASKEVKKEAQDDIGMIIDMEVIAGKTEDIADTTMENKDTEANTTVQPNEEGSEQINESKIIEEKENIPLNLDIKDVIEAKDDKILEECKKNENGIDKEEEGDGSTEPTKKRRQRTRSDDRHVNQEYQDKKETDFIKGMMKAIGIPDDEFQSIADLSK